MDKIGTIFKTLFCVVVGIFFVIAMFKDCNGKLEKGTGFNRHQKQQERQYLESKKPRQWSEEEIKRVKKISEEDFLSPQKTSQPQTHTHRSSSPRPHYEELWNDAEYYESLLDEADIEHESLDYPIDYHDLEDLKDEYINLLEENDIDY